jgi:hypothetical protein
MGAPVYPKEQRDAFKRRAVELKKQGMSLSKLSKEMGITKSQGAYYYYAGIHGTPSKMGPPHKARLGRPPGVAGVSFKKKMGRPSGSGKHKKIVSVLGSPVYSNGASSSRLVEANYIAGYIKGARINIQDVLNVLSDMKEGE